MPREMVVGVVVVFLRMVASAGILTWGPDVLVMGCWSSSIVGPIRCGGACARRRGGALDSRWGCFAVYDIYNIHVPMYAIRP